MKHNLKITAIILGMFIITQLIGMFVVYHYSPVKIVDGQVVEKPAQNLPYGLQPPDIKQDKEFAQMFISIIIAFVFAIVIIFLLSKFKIDFVLKLWFFVVVGIALGITFSALLPALPYGIFIVTLVSVPLAFQKIYGKDLFIHNFTELLIYPGIAAVFVPILNLLTIILLLIVISLYDMWAVWHSGFMQKMAKYQINKLNLFSGFFVPYMSKQSRQKLKLIRQKSLSSKGKSKNSNTKGVKVNVAILGGGDVIFPIIAAGVVLKTPMFGLYGALLVLIGATLGLTYLFFNSEKKKFYPAMPFITAGIFLGMLLAWIIL